MMETRLFFAGRRAFPVDGRRFWPFAGRPRHALRNRRPGFLVQMRSFATERFDRAGVLCCKI